MATPILLFLTSGEGETGDIEILPKPQQDYMDTYNNNMRHQKNARNEEKNQESLAEQFDRDTQTGEEDWSDPQR